MTPCLECCEYKYKYIFFCFLDKEVCALRRSVYVQCVRRTSGNYSLPLSIHHQMKGLFSSLCSKGVKINSIVIILQCWIDALRLSINFNYFCACQGIDFLKLIRWHNNFLLQLERRGENPVKRITAAQVWNAFSAFSHRMCSLCYGKDNWQFYGIICESHSCPQKLKMSPFTHPHVIPNPNPYDYIFHEE